MVSGTDVNYAAVTPWKPTVGFSKCKAWFMVTDNESDYLDYQLVMRSTTDPRSPNAWQAVEAGYSNPTTCNTGELAPPSGANLTTNLLFQLGVSFRKRSGAAGNPRAVINATTSVIRD